MPAVLTVAVVVAVVVVLSGLAIWLGHRGLRNPGPSSAGVGNALGGFDVFDPARARMKEDLDSKETEGEMFGAPDGDDQAVRVDLRTGTVHVRKPAPPPSAD